MDIRKEAEGMFEILKPGRTAISRPLIDGVHQAEGDDEQDLTVRQAGLLAREVGRVVVDEVQPLLELGGLDEREDGSNVGVLHPEQALGKVIRRKLREGGRDWTTEGRWIIIERSHVPGEVGRRRIQTSGEVCGR